MPTTRRTLALRLAMLLLAVACGSDSNPVGPDPVIAGDWSGSAAAGAVQFDATFTQDGDVVGGTGEFTSPLASDDFTVDGTLDGADVDLVLTSDELGATTFSGRFTGADRIEGTLALPGADLDLTLERH